MRPEPDPTPENHGWSNRETEQVWSWLVSSRENKPIGIACCVIARRQPPSDLKLFLYGALMSARNDLFSVMNQVAIDEIWEELQDLGEGYWK